MSLASPYQEHYYIADGETTRFSFGEYFSAPASANVKCIVYFEDGTSSVPTFTVDIATGYIDITALTTPDGQVLNAPPAGSSVRVFRDTPEQQNVTASQLQNYTAKQLEKIFDSIVAMIQEVSYSDKHKTLRLTETQRDVFLAFLKEANDDALLYWDNDARTVVPTDFVRQDVVRMSGGLFFRMKHDSQLRPYLEWSINGQTDWNSLNWQSAKDVADEAKEIAQEAKEIAQNAKDVADDAKDVADEAKEIAEGIDGKAQQALNNSVEALEVAEEAKEMIQNQIIVRSATMPTASADLVGKVYQYAGTTNGQYTHNYIYECVAGETTYSWVRVDVQPDRIAQIQALQADVTDIQALIPAQASPTNQLGDKNFINSSIATNTANFIGTFNSVAELEAYTGTVTNNDYAFVIGADSAGNTTYNRYKYNANTQQWIYEYTLNNSSFTAAQWAAINSGVTASDVSKARSAVQPSGVGNGRITITQGGVTKGTFTTNQGGNTTINLDAGGSGSDFDLFDTKWRDATTNNTRWLLSDGNWKTNTNAYQHLANEICKYTNWVHSGTTIYTKKRYPEVGDKAYTWDDFVTEVGTITAVDNVNHITVNNVTYATNSFMKINTTTETIAGTTVTYYQAADGHKICPASEESNVTAIYNATGVAWYYIIDVTNQRFKLPRSKHNKYADTVPVVGNGMTLGLTDGTLYSGMRIFTAGSADYYGSATNSYGANVGASNTSLDGLTNETVVGVTSDPTKSGMIAQQEQDTDQYKYLYFYVGN